jgi:hypothetical protein
MIGRTAAALLLVAAAAGAPASARAVDAPSGWVVTRTGRGPAEFSAWLDAEARSSRAVVGAYALKGRGATRTQDFAFTTTRIDWGFDGWVDAYGQAVDVPPCVAVTCDDPARTPARISVHTNGHRIESAIYVAAWESTTRLQITSPGWQARPWTPPMRVVLAKDGGGQGVRVTHTTYGTFKEAAAPGGRYGSFAMVTMPCGAGDDGVGEFTAGRWRRSLRCGDGTYHFAARGTRWRLAGENSGMGAAVVVLLVVDHDR